MHDQEVCLCKYHENLGLLLDGLDNILSDVPKTPEDLLNTTVCSTQNVKCMDRECMHCGVEKSVNQMFEHCDENQIILKTTMVDIRKEVQ